MSCFRKRKTGSFEPEQVDAGNISEKDRMLKEKEAEVFTDLIYCFAPCNEFLDCLVFWIPPRGFRTSGTVRQDSLGLGFRIPTLGGIPGS